MKKKYTKMVDFAFNNFFLYFLRDPDPDSESGFTNPLNPVPILISICIHNPVKNRRKLAES
jgi:hypothetical protein